MTKVIKCNKMNRYLLAADVHIKGSNKNNDTFERRYLGILVCTGSPNDCYPYWHSNLDKFTKYFVSIDDAKEFYNDNKRYLNNKDCYKKVQNVQIIKLEENVIETIV